MLEVLNRCVRQLTHMEMVHRGKDLGYVHMLCSIIILVITDHLYTVWCLHQTFCISVQNKLMLMVLKGLKEWLWLVVYFKFVCNTITKSTHLSKCILDDLKILWNFTCQIYFYFPVSATQLVLYIARKLYLIMIFSKTVCLAKTTESAYIAQTGLKMEESRNFGRNGMWMWRQSTQHWLET